MGNGTGAITALKSKWNATVAPTTTDDTNAGYSVGSEWINTTGDTGYICVDTTAASAVWKEITPTDKGQSVINYNDDDTTSSTTGTGWVNKLSLTFTAVAADYLIHWAAEVFASDSGTRVKTRIQRDDTETLGETELHSDTSSSIGWGTISGIKKLTLASGSRTFDIDYASSLSGKSVSVRRVRIYATKLA